MAGLRVTEIMALPGIRHPHRLSSFPSARVFPMPAPGTARAPRGASKKGGKGQKKSGEKKRAGEKFGREKSGLDLAATCGWSRVRASHHPLTLMSAKDLMTTKTPEIPVRPPLVRGVFLSHPPFPCFVAISAQSVHCSPARSRGSSLGSSPQCGHTPPLDGPACGWVRTSGRCRTQKFMDNRVVIPPRSSHPSLGCEGRVLARRLASRWHPCAVMHRAAEGAA